MISIRKVTVGISSGFAMLLDSSQVTQAQFTACLRTVGSNTAGRAFVAGASRHGTLRPGSDDSPSLEITDT